MNCSGGFLLLPLMKETMVKMIGSVSHQLCSVYEANGHYAKRTLLVSSSSYICVACCAFDEHILREFCVTMSSCQLFFAELPFALK